MPRPKTKYTPSEEKTLFLADFFNRADAELTSFDFKKISELLDQEYNGARRPSVIMRLHRRFCIMRMKTERQRIEAGAALWRV